MMFLLVHSKSKAQISASRSLRIAEFLAPHVEEPALRAGGRFVRQHLALHAAVAHRGEVVARRPDARGELLAEQVAAGGEALEGHVAVAVIFVAHDVEIELAAHDRQVRAPPVLDPLEFDDSGRARGARRVGAGAERRVQRRGLEVAVPCNRRARRSAGRRRTAARRGARFWREAQRPAWHRPSASTPVRSRMSWLMIGWPLLLEDGQARRPRHAR